MSAFKIYSSLDHHGKKLGLKSKAVFAAFALVLLIVLALSAYLLNKQLKQIGTMNYL
jgi:hypothetical protein